MNKENSFDTVYYPLTHPQKRIWYMSKIHPDTSLYNLGGTIRIRGSINFKVFEEAINLFVKRNDGVRLNIVEVDGEVKQFVSEHERINVDFIDFSIFENPEDSLKQWACREAKKPIALEEGRLFYFALLKIGENDSGYFVKFHHIISDGWSVNIMTEQIRDIYMKLLRGDEINDNSEYSYIGYINHENEYLGTEKFLKNKAFWKDKFEVLPEYFLNKSSELIEGERKTFQLDDSCLLKLKGILAETGYSLNTFFVAVYLIYMSKSTLQNDLVIGTPVLNRAGRKEKNMFGMFTSTMPFRFRMDDDYSINELLYKINHGLAECYYNQKYPYNLLLKDLELKKKGYENLFNISVNYYNTKLNSEIDGASVENIEFYNGFQIFSLQLVIKEWNEGSLTLHFDYKVNDFTEEQIDDMYAQMINLITQILKDPKAKVKRLSLLSEDERRNILFEYNNTFVPYPSDKTIYQLFEEWVHLVPEKVALSFGDIKLTYSELNKKANQLARFLIRKGIGKDKIVALIIEHSLETVISILAVLKAGGAYLPIDSKYPENRILYMLEDSEAQILLTDCKVAWDKKVKAEVVDVNFSGLYEGECTNIGIYNKPDDLVYVIYTSGSTGRPKGTMIEHRGLVNYILWAKDMYVKDDEEVFPLYSSLAFDLTVTSIFTPLVTGNKIVIYRDDEDEYVLYRIIKDNEATVIKLTPSHLSLLKNMDNKNSSVRRFIIGGEDLKVNLAKNIYESFGGKVELLNEYGPTEAVVGCMIHKYDYDNDLGASVPIGVPAYNTQIYVLDRNLEPLPSGTIGEMFISGDGVARGYVNRCELTQERFIDNPFIEGQRMYRTGDCARFTKDYKLEYTGRIDQQVKIRGHRIELAEIERFLLSFDSVKDTVVIVHEDVSGNKFLCAYIVEKEKFLGAELRNYLSKYLPEYMIPSYFITIDSIPLNANGKVNRDLLPEPEKEMDAEIDFESAKNEIEQELVRAICQVFNIETVSIKENFIRLGGDSISAIKLSSKLHTKGFILKVKYILSSPVIEEMALLIRKNNVTDINYTGLQNGSIKHTPISAWFFSQGFKELSYYNQSVLLELGKEIEISIIQKAVAELVKAHDSLRINYDMQKEELYYNDFFLKQGCEIEVFDISGIMEDEQREEISRLGEKLKSSFSIERTVLFKACIFNVGKGKKKLLLTAHHLVVDGVSWRILLEDLYNIINQLRAGVEIKLPPKSCSIQEWSDALRTYDRNALEYWQEVIRSDFYFPVDFDLGEDTVEFSNTFTEELTLEETEKLLKNSGYSYNVNPKDLLIMSLADTVRRFSGKDDIVFDVEGHGREEIFNGLNVTRTVGWFTSIYPVNIKINSENIETQIKSIKEQIRSIPDNGMGYGIYKYIYSILEDDNNQKRIRFNYLGDFSEDFHNDIFAVLDDNSGSDVSTRNFLTCLMDINSVILHKKLRISLTYSRHKFKDATMSAFLKEYIYRVKEIVEHCCNKESRNFTPSDFSASGISQKDIDSIFG